MKHIVESDGAIAFNGKVALLVLVAFVCVGTFGIFLYQSLDNTQPEEALELANQHVWYNSTGWAEAALAVTNTGGRDAVIQRIAVRGVECSWSDVYHWKTDLGPISDDLGLTSSELSGNFSEISVDGQPRVFQQATDKLTLEPGWTIVLYVKNPGNITASDAGVRATVTVFTLNTLYHRETYVQAPQGGTAGTLFQIQNVYWDSLTNKTRIAIQNYGTSVVKVVALYVGASRENTLDVTVYTDVGDGATIRVDDFETVTLDWPNTFDTMWASGEKYYFKVVAESGSPITQGPYTAS